MELLINFIIRYFFIIFLIIAMLCFRRYRLGGFILILCFITWEHIPAFVPWVILFICTFSTYLDAQKYYSDKYKKKYIERINKWKEKERNRIEVEELE